MPLIPLLLMACFGRLMRLKKRFELYHLLFKLLAMGAHFLLVGRLHRQAILLPVGQLLLKFRQLPSHLEAALQGGQQQIRSMTVLPQLLPVLKIRFTAQQLGA